MIGLEGDTPNIQRTVEQCNVSSSGYVLPSAADEPHIHLRQIEFNTIAASFAGLSQNLASYHR